METLGPPEKMEAISSDLASKKTRVNNAFGFVALNFPRLSRDVLIFSLKCFACP